MLFTRLQIIHHMKLLSLVCLRQITPAYYLMVFSLLAFSRVQGQEPAGMPEFKTESGFVQNRGQIRDQYDQPNPQVLYLWNGSGIKVQLRANGFSYDTWVLETDSLKLAAFHANPDAPGAADTLRTRLHRVDISFPGANPNPQIIAEEEMESKINVLGGGDNNFEGIKQFGKVIYNNIYPGIDLEFYARSGTDKPIEYNFVVHPGANPSQIRMAYAGANQVSLNEKGSILLSLSTQDLEEVIPASWTGEEKQPLTVSYMAHGEGVFGFAVPDYDPAQTLTIDPAPVFAFGTVFHVSPVDISRFSQIAADDAGNLYVSVILRGNRPNMATSGAYQTVRSNGSDDLLISKYNNRGQLLIATYYHNSTNAYIINLWSLSVSGNFIYVTGGTSGAGMETAGLNPFTPGIQSTTPDILVTKFNTSNLYPVWATYYGGTNTDVPFHTAVDHDGNLLVMFYTFSNDIPVSAPFSSFSLPTSNLSFGIAKFSPDGQRIFGGPIHNAPNASMGNFGYPRIHVAPDNSFVLSMTVQQDNPFMTQWNPVKLGNNPVLQSWHKNSLVAKFNSGGTRLWASYVHNNTIGGSDNGPQEGNGVVIDKSGKIWIAGMTDYSYTASTMTETRPLNFPMTPNALYPTVPDFSFANPEKNVGTQPTLICLSPVGSNLDYASLHFPGAWYSTGPSSGFAYRVNLFYDELDDALVFINWNLNLDFAEDDISPCADGYSATSVFSKFSTSLEKQWATSWILPIPYSSSLFASDYRNRRLYYAYSVSFSNDLAAAENYMSILTTPGASRRELFSPSAATQFGFLLGAFEEFSGIPEGLLLSQNTLSPLTQTACINGLPQTITGTKVTIQQPRGTDISLSYQWQIADAPSGPWTNISGATGKNYTPRPIASGQKYFRRFVTALNADCMLTGIDTSGVSALLLRNEIAPNAEAGNPKYYLCPGDAITLNGSASGGSGSGYQYEWYIGGATSPAQTGTEFTHSPEATVVYTLRVTDDAGCFAIDQVAVEPVQANAGPDVTFCEGSSGVKIGGTPVQGTSLVSYQWDADARLSCTACPQPVAVISANASFFLQANVTRKDGTQCFTRDTVAVTYVTLPGGDATFAGVDRTICYGSGTTLGDSAVANYSYIWLPSVFLSSAITTPATYTNSTTPVNNPLRYQLKATRGSCEFVDYVDLNTVYGRCRKRY
jgi:hypothetical protein